MATDATGTPTSLGIPKYNTSADAPSGLGFNAAMDAIDALIAARVAKPSGIASGEVPVWNGSTWDRSSVTKITASTIAPGSNGQVLATVGGVAVWGGGSSLIGIQILSGSGNYTPTAGTNRVWVEMVGGGAAGGGTPAAAAAYVGGGGGAGAYAASLLTSGFSGAAYVVGAGGAGVVGGAGGNGADTTWGTTVIVAKGGTGAALAVAAADMAGGAGGLASASTGLVKIDGQDGNRSTLAGGSRGGADGGNSRFGFGGRMPITINTNGQNGKGFGGGGSGAQDSSSGVARKGGDGTAGTIIVWEFA